MTKIRLKAHFDIVDREEYHAQMSHFRNSHRFDRLQDFTETRCILVFQGVHHGLLWTAKRNGVHYGDRFSLLVLSPGPSPGFSIPYVVVGKFGQD